MLDSLDVEGQWTRREESRVAPRYLACETWRMMVTFLLKREKGREINLARKKDNIFNSGNVES